jgi:hypothetical protein
VCPFEYQLVMIAIFSIYIQCMDMDMDRDRDSGRRDRSRSRDRDRSRLPTTTSGTGISCGYLIVIYMDEQVVSLLPRMIFICSPSHHGILYGRLKRISRHKSFITEERPVFHSYIVC